MQKEKPDLLPHFDRAAEQYEELAGLQQETAGRLAAALEPWKLILPPGPVLEFGAGTGFLTRELIRILPDREFTVTDLSPAMLEQCRRQLGADAERLKFEVLDAEEFTPGQQEWALIAGNFAAQWFRHPPLTLSRFTEALKPGGLLLTAFPGADSFPEWRKICLELGLPFTGNLLPDTEEMVIKLSIGDGKAPYEVDYYEDTRTVTYPSALDFFRYLKRIGADATLTGKRLTPAQFRLLNRHWDKTSPDGVRISWHMVFLVVKKG